MVDGKEDRSMDISTKVVAAIVTYNPDFIVLKNCLSSIKGQVEKVLIFDNGSSEQNDFGPLLQGDEEFLLFENGENLGLSANYNKALLWAKKNNFPWLLLLDQDSICPKNAIEQFLLFVKKNDERKIGILFPKIIYRNVSFEGDNSSALTEPKPVNRGISSGSFISVAAAMSVNGFDERYFIDYVDFEFSRKMSNFGFTQYCLPTICLSHELGNAKIVRFFFRNYLVYDKPLLRFYYVFRNQYFYACTEQKFYKKIKGILSFRLWCFVVIKNYSGNREALRRVLSLGIKDAKRKKMGKISAISESKIVFR